MAETNSTEALDKHINHARAIADAAFTLAGEQTIGELEKCTLLNLMSCISDQLIEAQNILLRRTVVDDAK